MGPVDGFELGSFNRFSRDTRGVNLSTFPHATLAGPFSLLEVSLRAWGGRLASEIDVDAVRDGGVDALVYWYEVRLGPGGTWVSRAEAGEFAWIVGQGLGAGGGGRTIKGRAVRVTASIEDAALHLGLWCGGDRDAVVPPQAPREEDEREDPFTQCAGIPLYHFSMVNDGDRARAYSAALRRGLEGRQGCVALDIGCGSGLLSLMAARAGAGHTYACDKAPGMAQCAQRWDECGHTNDTVHSQSLGMTASTPGDGAGKVAP